MSDYVIISDGSCDLSYEEAKELNVTLVPFYIEFKQDDYLKEGVDIEVRDFYQRLVDDPTVFPKTSMPSIHDYETIFREYAEKGVDVLCLTITKKFSGSFNSASNAKDMVLEEYPNARIEVVDTIVNTVLQGLVVKEAAKMHSNGASLDEVLAKINENKETGRIFFTVKGLSYLEHGGRIGKVSAAVGNILRIAPLITLKTGEIFSSGVALSRTRALLKIKDMLIHYLEDVKATPETYRIAVGYGHDIDEALKFKDMIKKALPDYDVDFAQIGATIAVHTGPHPLGVGVIKKF